jgi:uncharacterized protein (UPF0548 family)
VAATPNGIQVADLTVLIGQAERTWWRQLLGPLLLGGMEDRDTTVEVRRSGELVVKRVFRSLGAATAARERFVAEVRAMPTESLTDEVVEERLRSV